MCVTVIQNNCQPYILHKHFALAEEGGGFGHKAFNFLLLEALPINTRR